MMWGQEKVERVIRVIYIITLLFIDNTIQECVQKYATEHAPKIRGPNFSYFNLCQCILICLKDFCSIFKNFFDSYSFVDLSRIDLISLTLIVR